MTTSYRSVPEAKKGQKEFVVFTAIPDVKSLYMDQKPQSTTPGFCLMSKLGFSLKYRLCLISKLASHLRGRLGIEISLANSPPSPGRRSTVCIGWRKPTDVSSGAFWGERDGCSMHVGLGGSSFVDVNRGEDVMLFRDTCRM